MAAMTATAGEGTKAPRKPWYKQLYFWVLVGITAGSLKDSS